MIRRRSIARWLVHCADPLGPEYPLPQVLSPSGTSQLIAEAYDHGILPALLRHYPFPDMPDYEAARADAGTRRAVGASFTMMLRHFGGQIMAACKGLPMTVVKGWTFARLIYHGCALIGKDTILVTSQGKAFSEKYFYNWLKQACIDAGIRHCCPHGLRKSASRRLSCLGLPRSSPPLTGLLTEGMQI